MEMTAQLSWALGVVIALSAVLHFRSAPLYGWGRVFEVIMGVATVAIAIVLILGVHVPSAPMVPGCIYDSSTTGYYCAPYADIPGPTPAPEGD